VKNIARLTLFFSAAFILVFLLSAAAYILRVRIEAAQAIPARPLALFPALILAARKALPLGVYGSLLLALSYTSRRAIPIPVTILGLLILASGFTLALSLGISRAEAIEAPGPERVPATLGKEGLLLSRGNTVMVLLGDPADPEGPRVVSLPNRPLVYQERPIGPGNTVLELPPAPFHREPSFFLSGILTDTALTADQFDSRLKSGLIPFIIYSGSLIFLLVSLRFVLEFSGWPLANLFFGALVFRGVLAFEAFVNSREIQDFIAPLLGSRIPGFLITPLIFCGLGLLTVLYTALVRLAGDRRGPHA
jgi:hypothetical protein